MSLQREYTVVYVVNAAGAVEALDTLKAATGGVTQAFHAAASASAQMEARIVQVSADAIQAAKDVNGLSVANWKSGKNAEEAAGALAALNAQTQALAGHATGATAPVAGMATAMDVVHANSGNAGKSIAVMWAQMQLLNAGPAIVMAIGEQFAASRKFIEDCAKEATEVRDRLREIANLRGEHAPSDKLMGDMQVFALDTGMKEHEAQEYVAQFEGAVEAGEARKNITPAVEKGLAREGAQIGVRAGLDPTTAGKMAGLIGEYTKVDTVEKGAGQMQMVIDHLNQVGVGKVSALAPAFLGMIGSMVEEDGGRFASLPEAGAVFGATTVRAGRDPRAAATQVRTASKMLRRLDGQSLKDLQAKRDGDNELTQDETVRLRDLNKRWNKGVKLDAKEEADREALGRKKKLAAKDLTQEEKASLTLQELGITPQMDYLTALKTFDRNAPKQDRDLWMKQHGFREAAEIDALTRQAALLPVIESELKKDGITFAADGKRQGRPGDVARGREAIEVNRDFQRSKVGEARRLENVERAQQIAVGMENEEFEKATRMGQVRVNARPGYRGSWTHWAARMASLGGHGPIDVEKQMGQRSATWNLIREMERLGIGQEKTEYDPDDKSAEGEKISATENMRRRLNRPLAFIGPDDRNAAPAAMKEFFNRYAPLVRDRAGDVMGGDGGVGAKMRELAEGVREPGAAAPPHGAGDISPEIPDFTPEDVRVLKATLDRKDLKTGEPQFTPERKRRTIARMWELYRQRKADGTEGTDPMMSRGYTEIPGSGLTFDEEMAMPADLRGRLKGAIAAKQVPTGEIDAWHKDIPAYAGARTGAEMKTLQERILKTLEKIEKNGRPAGRPAANVPAPRPPAAAPAPVRP